MVENARVAAPHQKLNGFLVLSCFVHLAVLFGFVMPQRPLATDLKVPLAVSLSHRPTVQPVALQRNSDTPTPMPAASVRTRPAPDAAAIPTDAPPSATHLHRIPMDIGETGLVDSVPQQTPPIPTSAHEPAQRPETAIAASPPNVASPISTERRGKPSTLWLAEYTQAMTAQVARVKAYPQIARLRGWEGTAVVTVHLSADGTILDARVAESSGHEILDRQAINMVRRADPMPPFPAGSFERSGSTLEVRLPIVFALAARD